MSAPENPSVVIVGPSPHFTSGISTYTIRLANALAKTGASVGVISYRRILPRFLFPGRRRVGKHITSLQFDPAIEVVGSVDYHNPFSWARAARFLRKTKPDLVLFQWWSATVAHMHLYLARVAKRLGCKVAFEMHETLDPFEDSVAPIRLYARAVTNRLMPKGDLFVVHSQADAEAVAHRFGVRPDRIVPVAHGMYDHFGAAARDVSRRKLGLNSDEFVFLAFGLIRAYKGIPDLIEAFGSIPSDFATRVRLLVVGEVWEDGERIQQVLERNPHKDRIQVIRRYIPDDEVGTHFSAADALVLPYTRASQSGVAHIAMSYGLPILGTRVGGLSEALAKYPGARTIPPLDQGALARALMELVQQKPAVRLRAPRDDGWTEAARAVLSLARPPAS